MTRNMALRRSSAPAGYWLIFLIFIISQKPCDGKLTCLETPGKNTIGETCEGDYCMYAELPGFDLAVRGCLSGDLLKSDIAEHCERSADGRDVCLCKKEGCNINNNGIPRREIKSVNCYLCDGPAKNCSRDRMCKGKYCTFTNYPDGKISRGCSDPSMPLFESKGLGSCVTPAFPSQTARNWDESNLQAVTCACNHDHFCNGVNLYNKVSPTAKTKKCKVKVYGSFKLGTHLSPPVPDCIGEHCFNIQVDINDVMVNISGCTSSFLATDYKKQAADELNETGCMIFQSKTMRTKACFGTDEKPSDTHKNKDEKTRSNNKEGKNNKAQKPTIHFGVSSFFLSVFFFYMHLGK